MGGLVGGLLGGGEKSSSSQTNTSGFYGLPSQLQTPITNYADFLYQTYGLPHIAREAFRPIGVTADEQLGFDAMRRGFAPTQQSINSDIAMQMNPFDTHVIDAINREAGGEYSILKQALNQAGQFGSNRQMLGANDIDLTRLNQIGTFKQGQFDTAMNNALNVLPQQRMQDAQNLANIGSFMRNLDMQYKQTPINYMKAYGQSVAGLPVSFGESSHTTTTGTSGSSGSNVLNAIGSIAGALGMFSDRRLKADIEAIGRENGWPIYKFRYKGDDQRYIGVMADEVEDKMPEAIIISPSGYKMVDYGRIGVTFREA